ncbi:sugar kinase [Aeromicrobium flavum]|uniref:Sugar kinase n=1 Tax=Aeromicrobium flavum TaxID=416568 RepID=A0A512HTK1_9ACTN|nr:ROK family transcriptional regulator [Aeromicrobium flavum]GEO88783.1 sugar kinase [Aeromicrobium flavum]
MSGHGEVLALFRRHGPLTRAQVVELSGLSRATATHRLDLLVRARLLRPRADDRSTGGRPAGVFDLAEDRGSLLVADIGSSHARYGLADLAGRVLTALDEDIAIDDGPEVVLAGVVAAFDRLVTAAAPPVLGVAIGLPGPVDQRTGRLVSPPTMNGWDGVDVADRLAEHVSAPVVVDKDANLVALGVHRALRADAVPGADDLLVVKVGMGIGAGIISRGQVLHGTRGGAGDLGHIPHDDGPKCRCGQRGCAEASAGAWAIAAHLRELGHPVRTSADVVALAAHGDRDARAAVRAAGRRIGDVVIEAVGVLNPALVVVGGDLAEAGDLLVDGVRERVFERSHPLATTDLSVIASPLGADAGLLGAAQMAADAALAPDRVEALVGG